MNQELKEAVWNESLKLRCTLLRYHKIFDIWICQDEDPCLVKKCGDEKCINYGKPFIRQNELMII